MKCPECQLRVSDDSNYCSGCGYQFFETTVTPKARTAIGCERKNVTIMFSDLSGYTAMAGKLDPEELKEIMNRIFGDITRIIQNYDGFIERFVGDAVMAVFGVPVAHEDDAVRAIRAAIDIHKAVEDFSPKVEKNIGCPLTMHTGINTGLVVTGEVDVLKGTHGLTGDAINLASRLEGVAGAGEIVVGADTFCQSCNFFDFETLEPHRLKGKEGLVKIYKVKSTKDQPYKIHRLQGLRAELVGRDEQMVILKEAVKKLKTGEGSIITVRGDAGTGKSRLKRELRDNLDLSHIQWREGHAYDYTRNVPYYPLINLLAHIFQIAENDSLETIRSKIEKGTASLLGESGESIAYIGSLFSLTYPQIEGISPDYWKAKVQESIQLLIAALVNRGPTVICFEDLHWADASFTAFLKKLMTAAADSALFICTFRTHFSLFTSETPDCLQKRLKEIRLEELLPSDAQQMVFSLLKTESLPYELIELILRKAEGNPFYLEEMLNSLIDQDILSQDDGSWKLNRQITEADMPKTIQGVLTARVDNLDKFAKRVLQEASVIGRSFLYAILERITETDTTIDQYLANLEGLDLIRTQAMAPELEYIFKHALTQEVVYSGLLKKERREIHERIGLAIERLFPDRIFEFCEILAYHFQRGHSKEKAIYYLVKSGEKSLNKFALEQAHDYFQLSIDLLPIEDIGSRKNKTILFNLLNTWALVYYYRGDMGGMLRLFNKYSDQVVGFEDKAALAMFLAWYGYAHWGCEKYTDAETLLNQALQIAEDINDQKIIAYIHTWLAWQYVTTGRYDQALASGQQAIQIAQIYKTDSYIQFKPMSAVAFVYFSKGERKKLLHTAEQMLTLGETKGNFPARIFGIVLISASYVVDGNFSKAVEWSEKVDSSGREIIHENAALYAKGLAYFLNGDIGKAKSTLETMVNYCSERWPYLAISGEIMLAAIEVASGRMNAGMQKIHRIRNTFQKNERRFDYTLSEYLLGNIYCRIALGQGNASLSSIMKNIGFLIKNLPFATKKAEKHLNAAIALADQYEAMGVKGEALLELGRLYAGKKRPEKAKDCLRKAVEVFESCEIDTFKQMAQEALADLD